MNLKNRHFLKLSDFTPEEITACLDLATELKTARKAGRGIQRMKGKNIALIFEKTSARTRCAFEVTARDQGTGVIYLELSASQTRHKESIRDTIRMLSRMYDGIEYRGFGQDVVEELAKYAGVPVFSGLTNEFCSTQMLADALAMRKHSGRPLNQTAFAYVDDARYNMANSLLVSGAKLDMDVCIGAPKILWSAGNTIARTRAVAEETGGKILLTEDAEEAVRSVDFTHTDVWVDMGELEKAWQERIGLLKDCRVTPELMAASGNPQVKFMYCLPTFHNRGTKIGKWIYETFGLNDVEVTEEVFESPANIVSDQAENRLHTIKAVVVAALGDWLCEGVRPSENLFSNGLFVLFNISDFQNCFSTLTDHCVFRRK